MINEYLFMTNEHRTLIAKYKPQNIISKIYDLPDTSLWVASYHLKGNNKDNASKLSAVHTYVMQYAPLVLSCESSAYYNKELFPLVNELERKLRKLLYLSASISNDDTTKENIKQLEEKDFGAIFDLLFIDQDFITNLKKRVNADNKSEYNGKSKYSKEEIKSFLNSLPEKTLWDTIIAKGEVATLRNNFREVQTFRNDVMHAHDISEEEFDTAKAIFLEVNNELDSTIEKLTSTSEDMALESKRKVNLAISSAISAMNISTISDTLYKYIQSQPAYEKILALAEQLKDNRNFEVLTALQETINNLPISQAQNNIGEALNVMKDRVNDIVKDTTLNLSLMNDALNSYNTLPQKVSAISNNIEPVVGSNHNNEADNSEP